MIILGPKTAILGPQFCRILVLGPHFWWSGGAWAPRVPPDLPLSDTCRFVVLKCLRQEHVHFVLIRYTTCYSITIRQDLFYLLDYVTSQSEKLEFQKTRKRILPDITAKLLVFGIIRNHRENVYFETSLSFGKLYKNYNKWGPCLFL